MKKLVAILAALALAFVLPTPASADTAVTEPMVSVGDFGQYFVQKGKKVTVKPEIVKQGAVTVTSAKITVKHGRKTVAKNVKSVKLRSGSYQVTTKITWTAAGDPAVKTTVSTRPLRISTLTASTQAAALLQAINAARANVPGMADAMAAGKAVPLQRSAALDKIATSWSTKSAKKHKPVAPDWAQVSDAYEWVWYLPLKTWSPYHPTMAAELAAGYLSADSPLAACGAHEVGGNVISDCSADMEARWSHLGVGFAWDSAGKLWLTLLLASDGQ
ncbi:MAG: hypothetical protein J0I14_03455 [Propionibacteriaceae bacterium]|nr:hypothetical protein [Propionibacteriaceae bacterium]